MSGDELWHDRRVEVDVMPEMFELATGELVAGRFVPVEDSKENQRIKGVLTVTNLRVLWHACTAPRVNLSIGMDCIVNISNKLTKSKIEGVVETVKVLTQCGEDRKEFGFKCSLKESKATAATISSVLTSYKGSRAYRTLRLRNPLQDGVLKLLPREHICSSVPGVCNLSDDQGYIGDMVVTNLRVFWVALNNHMHNLSLPYLQVKTLFVHNSKFGTALTFETSQVSQGYRFGFRMDPLERMKEACKEIKKLIETYRHCPDYGVNIQTDSKTGMHTDKHTDDAGRWKEDNCELDSSYDRSDVYSVLYKADKEAERGVVYNEELGLMVEELPGGVEIEAMCRVLA